MSQRDAILAALGYPEDTPAEWEPLGDLPGSAVHLIIGGERPLDAVVRQPADREAAMNQAAVSEALDRRGYRYAPKLLAFAGEATIEEMPAGHTALQLVPPPGAAEAAVEALATWHALPLREGLDWGRSPADLLPPEEVPLHRLGFSAIEREPAKQPLLDAHGLLLGSPFGFAHRDATAANVVLAPGRAWLCDFSSAGFGPQLWDVAAFLLTSGLEAPGRRALASAYARFRGMPADATADLLDAAGILWGITWALDLPRRLITNLGDDPATDALKLMASRIDRGIRQPAGDSPVAAAIRVALWS